MNSKLNKNLARILASQASKSLNRNIAARQTPEAQKARDATENFSATIYNAIDNAKTVEDLVNLEMALQEIDKTQTSSEKDMTGIENAQRDYRQLAATVEQMRRTPQEYFEANLSMKETAGDFKKMPRSRGLQQISGNKTRMQNRSSFAHEDDRKIWDARIVLADKTEAMLKTLHNNLAKNYERRLQIEEKQATRDERGKGIVR